MFRNTVICCLVFIISWQTGYSNADTVLFYDFCRVNHLIPKFNINMNYVDIEQDSNTLRLYLSMPYIVHSGSIYYLPGQASLSDKGEVLLPPQTARKILELIVQSSGSSSAKSAVQSYSSVGSRPEPTSIKKMEKSSSSSSEPIVIKNDQSVKKDYNNFKDDFIPIDSIIVDPGHGGKDPGGLGLSGIKEKEIVLTISRLVFQELKKGGTEKIYFTRKDDRYVTLKERTDKTSSLLRKNLNPIFISIHGNISLNRNTDGLEVYSLSDKASDEDALSVEAAENAGFSRSDVERTESLSRILNDMLKDGIRRQSEELSRMIAGSLNKSTGAVVRGIKKANFYVLKYNSLPSVLIEVGFMSNPDESKKLMDTQYQRKAARGIANGIRNFLENYNKSRGFTR